MGGRTYSPAELARIRAEYSTARSPNALARSMGRDPSALKQKAREMGLHRPAKATPAERTAALLARYADAPDLQALAKELGITHGSLTAHAYRLGVKRNPRFLEEARALGAERSLATRKAKNVHRAVRATLLDAAWRGLPIGE